MNLQKIKLNKYDLFQVIRLINEIGLKVNLSFFIYHLLINKLIAEYEIYFSAKIFNFKIAIDWNFCSYLSSFYLYY